MNDPERWSEVVELFRVLFAMPAEERQRALDAVADADLRAEVGALLDTHDELQSTNGGFLELDAIRASTLLEDTGPSIEGASTIGRYRILRRLGRGGMGIVYKAHDPRLDRSVALKLLPPHLSADPAAIRRLTVEARAASALDHPNIETVYEIGETDDGRPFIAMAYYDGETLRQRLARGPLSIPEVVDFGVQLAQGLSAAHHSGIVHRDIKPENILLTRDGVLKIVDFGVAKVVNDALESAGLPRGTAVYMSPEQTRGEAVDHRTDVWSAGVVLYEMLAGSRPFGGAGEALIHAIRNDDPRPLREARTDLSSTLAMVVARCLEKSPEERFESAADLATDLRSAVGRPATREARLPSRPGPRARWLAGAAVFAVLALLAIQTRAGREVAAPDVLEAAPAIAVLPFEVQGSGLDIWREGMVDLLSTNLDGVGGLRAIDSRTVLAQWRKEGDDAGASGLERALDVARGTGARYAVIGNVVSTGSRMRLGAQIYSLEDAKSLASLHVEGPPDSIFALVDRLSIDALAAIWQGRERPRGQIDLTRITTTSLPALKAFLEGEGLLRRADWEGAVAAYERAVAADSTFAFAQYHLGLAHGWLGNEEQQNQAYQGALRHAGRLPERERILLRAVEATVMNSAVLDVIALYQEATRKYPDDADAWYQLGDRYWHEGEQTLGSREESERAFRKAVELDPGFAPAYIHLVHNAFIYHPDSARAARLIDLYHRLAPNSDSDQQSRVAFGLAFGDSTARGRALADLDTLPPGSRGEVAGSYLDHPSFWAQQEIVFERGPWPDDQIGWVRTSLFENKLSRGRLKAALASLDDPLMYPDFRVVALYRILAAGLPARGISLDRALALPPTDSLPVHFSAARIAFYAGAYAADQGRWEDHAAAVARLGVQAARFRAAGDSSASRRVMEAAAALRGQGLWRRGDAERALPLLTDGQRQVRSQALNATIRWWLGELLLEMGRPQEAARYFESFWNDPFAADRLAPIYEQLGERTKAREAYALVAFAWKDADPELQPRVREAREAIHRLARGGK